MMRMRFAEYAVGIEEIAERNTVVMTKGAWVVDVRCSSNSALLCAVIDQDETEKEDRVFQFVQADDTMPSDLFIDSHGPKYVGKFSMYGDVMVYHVFEAPAKDVVQEAVQKANDEGRDGYMAGIMAKTESVGPCDTPTKVDCEPQAVLQDPPPKKKPSKKAKGSKKT